MINFTSPVDNNKSIKKKLLTKISKVISDGKYILGDSVKKFEKKFSLKVYENYGTSETCFISAENEKNINSRSLYSVGKILPWIKIKKNKIKVGVGGKEGWEEGVDIKRRKKNREGEGDITRRKKKRNE